MKKYLLSVTFATFAAVSSFAQRTPQASPGATIIQTVGITDFTIKYSRPSVKGRALFTENAPLAPTGQLWRTGANLPTTLEVSTEFTFGNQKVPAGKYSVYSIPDKAKWTVILNKNTTGGVDTYKENDDVARVTAFPVTSENKESFEFSFNNLSDSTAVLNMAWGTVKVPVNLHVSTHQLTLTSLDRAVESKPEDVQTLQSAAGYLLSKNIELRKALALTDKAIGLKESWSNVWIKAQIFEKLGKSKEALPLAQKALTLGTANPDGAFVFYKPQITNAVAEMQAKLPKETPTKGKKTKK